MHFNESCETKLGGLAMTPATKQPAQAPEELVSIGSSRSSSAGWRKTDLVALHVFQDMLGVSLSVKRYLLIGAPCSDTFLHLGIVKI